MKEQFKGRSVVALSTIEVSGAAAKALRQARQIKQEAMAPIIGTTQGHLSTIEQYDRLQVNHLLMFAYFYQTSPAQFAALAKAALKSQETKKARGRAAKAAS